MSKNLYRCSTTKCNKRHHFKKPVEEYARPKKCPDCGAEITKRDNWQIKKNAESKCNCDAFHHPHQAGSSVWCVRSKVEPSDEDYEDRYNKVNY